MMLRTAIISLLVAFAYPCLTGCGQATTQTARTGKTGNDSATCILHGAETMTYYYGDSATMEEKKEGSIYDHVFMSYVLASIKKHSKDSSFTVVIRPIASADVMSNIKTVIDIFNTNDIQNRYVDKAELGIVNEPLKLNLPTEDKTVKPIKVGENDVTLILYGNGIYAYAGKDIASGSIYTYTTIDGYIKNKVKKLSANGFAVIIKPNDDSSYKNMVDVLDEMKTNNIKKYTLVDITKEEVGFIKKLK